MYQQQHIEFIIQKAKKRLDLQEAPGCTKAGWLMITALLIESWDIYSMAFILFALKDIYEPSSWLLGFTAAGTQLGAVVGALLGGWLTDKLGRRKIFLWSMILFAIFAVLQGLAPNMYWLAIIRCLAGIPVGADVANGFTYIMEVMPKGKREVMANRWQFMFALGIIAAILLVTTLVALDVHPDMIWRIVLAVPAIPACLLLFMRRELPETPAWFVERGRFIEAKKPPVNITANRMAVCWTTFCPMKTSPSPTRRSKRRCTICSAVRLPAAPPCSAGSPAPCSRLKTTPSPSSCR
jgi:MFS family permease